MHVHLNGGRRMRAASRWNRERERGGGEALEKLKARRQQYKGGFM